MAMISPSVFAGGCPTLQNSLIISEYIEGGSFNKAIEIFNGTGATVDFDISTVEIILYSNGSPTASSTYTFSGSTLADGGIFVLAHGSSNAGILAIANDTSSGTANWNGDDAIELRVNGVVVDSIGQVGFDPGSFWGTGSVTTQNDTLTRMGSICGGDTDSSNAYDTTEWNGLAQDDISDLGSNGTGLLPVELMNFSVE